MRVIQGSTVEEKLLSVDGILEGLLKKQMLVHDKMNKKNQAPHPFNISGYIDKCISGDMVCACLSLSNIQLKRAVIVVDELPKNAEAYIDIRILNDEGQETATRVKLRKGVQSGVDERKLRPGDKVSIVVVFPSEAPQGVWVAMRGDIL